MNLLRLTIVELRGAVSFVYAGEALCRPSCAPAQRILAVMDELLERAEPY